MPKYPEGIHYDLMPMGKTRDIEAWKKIIKDYQEHKNLYNTEVKNVEL